MNLDERFRELICLRRVQVGLLYLLAVVAPSDLRSQIPPNSGARCSLEGPTYNQPNIYVQPRIQRADTRQKCRGDWTRAGYLVPQYPAAEEEGPGTTYCVWRELNLGQEFCCDANGQPCGICDYPACTGNPCTCKDSCTMSEFGVTADGALYHGLRAPPVDL